MAIYVRQPDGTYKPLILDTPDNQARLYQQLLNNRIMLLKALQKAGLSISKTPDYIYSDIFTDADGWLNTVDTAGTNAVHDKRKHLYYNADKISITDTPKTPPADFITYTNTVIFNVYYTINNTWWRITKIRFYDLPLDCISITITRTDTGEVLFSSPPPFPSEELSLDLPYILSPAGFTVKYSCCDADIDSGCALTIPYRYDSTVNNVRVVADPGRMLAYDNTRRGPYSVVDVEILRPTVKYIKTNIFSLPSPIKQLLVFADRELINNAPEVEVEVYDTNDNLLATGTIMEIIDISNYNVSSVYLKLKLNADANTGKYTKVYGYAVAFWV